MNNELDQQIVWRDDPSYEQNRQAMLWNALKPARYPSAIVRATTDDDVVAAIRLALVRDAQVAVRGGGHSWVGSPLRDDTILVDMSARRGVHVDERSRTATVEPGVTSQALADALAPHGLAFPVGHCASVGMGGYLLSGGLGWNSGAWGPACASVFAVDIVTAAGELIRADDEHHPELLWAARGAGPGFPGVVTRFHVALQALPRAITTTTHVHDVADLDELASWASQVAASLPPTVEMTVLLTAAGADLPSEPDRKVAVVTATAFADTAGQAAADLAPIGESEWRHRALVARDNRPSPYDVLFRDFGGRWREGCRFASDNVWTDGDLRVLLPLRQALLDAPGPSSFAFAAMSPDPVDGEPEPELPDMAFSMYARTFVACYAMWEHASDDDANLAWLPLAMAELEATATGHYVAEADLLAAPSRATRSFAEPSWSRLERIRQQVDPAGRFVTYLHPPAAPSGSPPAT
jgi:FAD/FMN-containing dehydrogenase